MSLVRLNLILVSILLLGYAFLDKTFAYIGIWPLFIGEIILIATLFTTLISGVEHRYLRSPITVALLAFLLWQGLILVFFASGNLVTALRDSAIWYYAIFAILIASWLLRLGAIEQCLDWYSRWIPWFAVWAAPAFIISDQMRFSLPQIPGTGVTLLQIKPGDIAVHLAGIAAFLVLGLHREFPRGARNWIVFKEVVCYSGVLLGVIATGSRNRGGLISVLLAILVVTILRPNNRLNRLILPVAFVATLLIAFDVKIPTGGDRDISLNQIIENAESVVGRSESKSLKGTVDWRLNWWNSIVDDTVNGENFWHGIGYGTDLAARFNFTDRTGNRSPHSAHLTLLGRSGVPGLVLWIGLVGTIYLMLLRGYVLAQANNRHTLAKVNLWVMGYFTAFLVNMSVDVYLEGPQGGIWFWALVGFAIALTYAQSVNAKAPRSHARVPTAVGRRRVGAAFPKVPANHRR